MLPVGARASVLSVGANDLPERLGCASRAQVMRSVRDAVGARAGPWREARPEAATTRVRYAVGSAARAGCSR